MTEHRQIIAILRGITPQETEAVCTALVEAGITQIEIPLNSPDVFSSIQCAATVLSGRADIGAGTVLTVEEVDNVRSAGGTFIVSPNCDPQVIAHTVSVDMRSFPGVFSPTEAFTAIEAGATGLKMFPAEVLGARGIKALKAVLPPEIPVFAVGGAGPDNFGEYFAAGCVGFGLGSFLFKPGMAAEEVRMRALQAVEAYDGGLTK